jgi:sialate O-acetylesterase
MAIASVLAISCPAHAEITMPTLFSDHMVLQQGMEVPIWGTADDGEVVTVEFDGQLEVTTAMGGEWMVTLAPMLSSNTPSDMVITGDNVITITGVQVGEVWVCSGQSNMVWKLIDSDGAEQAIEDSGNHNIRLFILPNESGPEDATWEICDSNTSPDSYAVAFFFARELAMNLNVPIGLIEAAKGATGIHHWTTLRDGILYEKKIAPLQPYGIRGTIWYQGEWDAQSDRTAQLYYETFPGLIDEWRQDWGQVDFPFLYVQLPRTYMRIPGWMIIRDAQLATLAVPNTAMACTIDLPGAMTAHPTCKEPVGYRLALGALKKAYEQDIVYSGPIYDPDLSYIDQNTFVIGFDHVEGGLTTIDGVDLTGFEIAGEDANFIPANAYIDDVNNTVVVSSPFIDEPVAVQYGWDGNPECNLIIDIGPDPCDPEDPYKCLLPASPFRTDELVYPPRYQHIDD